MKPSTYIPYEETQALDARVTELETKTQQQKNGLWVLYALVILLWWGLIVTTVIFRVKP